MFAAAAPYVMAVFAMSVAVAALLTLAYAVRHLDAPGDRS